MPDFEHPTDVAPTELLARCNLDGKSKVRADNTVRAALFSPARDGCTSVFRADGMSAAALDELEDEHIAGPQNRTAKGRALVAAGVVTGQALRLETTQLPHPRHVNISDWPGDEEKELAAALEIASAASYVARST